MNKNNKNQYFQYLHYNYLKNYHNLNQNKNKSNKYKKTSPEHFHINQNMHIVLHSFVKYYMHFQIQVYNTLKV
jgi:hypothetical protein